MSSSSTANPARRLDLTALAKSLGNQLRGRPPENAIALVHLFIQDGLSARAVAREAGVTEHIPMLLIDGLGR